MTLDYVSLTVKNFYNDFFKKIVCVLFDVFRIYLSETRIIVVYAY